MVIFKICTVALVSGICALILKSHKSDLVPLCVTAGGIILVLYSFDYLKESLLFIREFTEQTEIDNGIIRLIFKVIGIGYLFELTAQSISDLGFSSISDKLIICGKLIIFVLSVPLLRSTFGIITELIKMV